MSIVVSLNRCIPGFALGLLGLAAVAAVPGCGRSAPAGTAGTAGAPQQAEAPAAQPASLVGDGHDHGDGTADLRATADEPSAENAAETARERALRSVEERKLANATAGLETATSVKLEPAVLDLGEWATNTSAKGNVRLVNISDAQITIADCKANCGCTTTNCPKGKKLAPGEGVEVEVSVTTGGTAHKIAKAVTFIVEGQGQVKLPVEADVIAYVAVEPQRLDVNRNKDGRMVLKSTDGQPFTITGTTPPDVLEQAPSEPAAEHEVVLSWEKWEQLPARRATLIFNLDHPKASTVQAFVMGSAPPPRTNTLAQEADRLRQNGVVDQPLNRPEGAAQLGVAITRGDVEALRKALETVTDQPSRDGALALAARQGRTDMVEVLIESGASVEARDSQGCTPLITAVRKNKADVVRVLLARGADVNARDKSDSTALCWSAGSAGDPESLRSLIGAGANVNAADKNGMTPLLWAARYGDAARAQILIQAGADVAARDRDGQTALDLARKRKGSGGMALVELFEHPAEGKADAAPTPESAGG